MTSAYPSCSIPGKIFGDSIAIIILIVFVVVPFILLTVCYTSIVWSIYRQGKRNRNLGSEAQKKRMNENRRITLMLKTVVITFLISWTPHYVYFFWHYFPSTKKAPCNTLYLYLVAQVINYLYTVINPVIYYSFSANYRREFRKVFCTSNNEIESLSYRKDQFDLDFIPGKKI